MRGFEFKLSAYFEVYQKMVEVKEAKVSDDDQEEKEAAKQPKYESQKDFISIV